MAAGYCCLESRQPCGIPPQRARALGKQQTLPKHGTRARITIITNFISHAAWSMGSMCALKVQRAAARARSRRLLRLLSHSCSIMALFLAFKEFQEFFLAHPYIIHDLPKESSTEFFTRMYWNYCAPAVRMLHNKVAVPLSYGLETDFSESFNDNSASTGFNFNNLHSHKASMVLLPSVSK